MSKFSQQIQTVSEFEIESQLRQRVKPGPDTMQAIQNVYKLESWREIWQQLKQLTNPHLVSKLEILAEGENLPLSYLCNPKLEIKYGLDALSSDLTGKVYREAAIGYRTNKENFLQIGTIPGFTIKNGLVHQICFSNSAQKEYIFNHIRGGAIATTEVKQKIKEVNQEVFDYLWHNTYSQRETKKFSESRGWDDAMLDRGRYAYLDPSIDLANWARQRRYTFEDLYRAGWMTKNCKTDGTFNYQQIACAGVLIPYLNDKQEIDSFRIRSVKNTGPKYISIPPCKELQLKPSVYGKLYGADKRDQAAGKEAIILEGEIKTDYIKIHADLVAFGLQGTSQGDEEIADYLVKANCSRYYVAFDADPLGKALRNVEGVTTSQKDALKFALRLREAGAKEVYLIVLESENGEKMGVDDLFQMERGQEKFAKFKDNALTIEEYAEHFGLSVEVETLALRHHRLNSSCKAYQLSCERNGTPVNDRLIQKAHSFMALMREAERTYCEDVFQTSNRFEEGFYRFDTLKEVMRIPGKDLKFATTADGEYIDIDRFKTKLLELVFVPADFPAERVSAHSSFIHLPFSSQEINAVINHGDDINPDLVSLMEKGSKTLGDESPWRRKNSSELTQILLAGYLQRYFPANVYDYAAGIQLSTWSHFTEAPGITLPLTIFNQESGNAVALVDLVLQPWNTMEKPLLVEMSEGINGANSFFRQESNDQLERLASARNNIYQELLRLRDKDQAIGAASSYEASWAKKLNRDKEQQEEQLIALDTEKMENFIEVLKLKALIRDARALGLVTIDHNGNPVATLKPSESDTVVFRCQLDDHGNCKMIQRDLTVFVD